VKQGGKWLPWALIDVGSVPNPHLLFALADEARRMHSPSESEPQEEGSISPQRHEGNTKGHKETG